MVARNLREKKMCIKATERTGTTGLERDKTNEKNAENKESRSLRRIHPAAHSRIITLYNLAPQGNYIPL